MDKYLTLFNNHQAYTNYKNSNNFATPNVSYCEQENEVHYNPYVHNYSKDYFTIESLEDNNTIYLKASNTSVTKTISVSIDNGETWNNYTSTNIGSGTTLATLNSGDKLFIKGQNGTYGTFQYYNQFKTTGQFEAKGNIMSLISGDSFTNADELTTSYTFSHLFHGCSGLTSAENLILPATTLAESCYSYMFAGCTGLVNVPQIGTTATTMTSSACEYMFSGCTSLTTAPELPNRLSYFCYRHMFEGCTSLTTPPQLTSTSLMNCCYEYMFAGCTSLVNAPTLPATILAHSCYGNMFEGCTSLATAPTLPATGLSEYCYYNMFLGCTSLTATPELPATTLVSNCYNSMFRNCSSLSYIKAMFTTTPSKTYTSNWVSGVASTGTFVKNSAATWNVTGNNGVPTGWTVQTASA